MHITRAFPVWALIFLQALLGLNALVAGGSFLIAPDGHLIQMPLSNLDNSPFTNFLIPGLLLLIFVGIFPLLVAYSLWRLPGWRWPEAINPFRRFHWSWAGSLAAGLIVIIWILVQIQWILVGVLHYTVLIWGFVILLITLTPAVRRYCLRKTP